MSDPVVRRCMYAGVALVAFATLVLQIAYTRLYSALFGNHMAFLAISLSLFGVGLGGVMLFVFPGLVKGDRVHGRLAAFSVAAGVGSLIAFRHILSTEPVEKLNADVLSKLSLLYAVSALPFVLTGLVVAAALKHAAEHVSRLYLFDMLGAAAGGAGALLALRSGVTRAFLVGAILCAGAGIAFGIAALRGPSKSKRSLAAAGIAFAAAVLLLVSGASDPWFKLRWLRYSKVEDIEFQKWNELALVTVDKPSPDGKAWLRMDGGAASLILRGDVTAPIHPDELGYVLHGGVGPVLVIGPAGGLNIRAALRAGQSDIDAAEINPTTVNDVMFGKYLAFSGEVYRQPGVNVRVADGRSFVRRSPRRYRNILISLIDTWAAASVGALSLSENSLYTVEAFSDFISHLDADGTLTVHRWDPEFERLLVLASAGLRANGVSEPSRHLFACGSFRSTSLLIKRSAYAPDQIESLRRFCRLHNFYEMFAPDAPKTALRARLTREEDPRVAAPGHPNDLSAPTDDRPFFFYTVPPRDLTKWLRDYTHLEAQNQGLLSLTGMLVASLIVSIPLTILPLILLRRRLSEARSVSTARALLFFTCLGFAFVFVELALVQNFVMFLGHPVYALSTVLVALLAWTGIGSFTTDKIDPQHAERAARKRAMALAAALLILSFALGPLLRSAVGLPLLVRILLTILLLGPLGVLMGSQAPLGLRLLGAGAPGLIPWSWGLNGLASVVATAAGTLLALNAGFRSLLVAAAATYLAGAFVIPRLSRQAASVAPIAP